MTWEIFKDIFKHLCISGLLTLEWKTSCCEEELGGDTYWGVFDPWWCGSFLSVKVWRRWCICRGVCQTERQRYFWVYIFIRVSVCVWNKRMFKRAREREQRAMCWRMSGKKEPGSSADLDQPFHGKRTHAVFLFGCGWLYEFIMPLGEHSAKNQHWNPLRPPANPSIGPTFIILTFPLRGSDIKVDPPLAPLLGDGGVILTVWEADCRPALVLLSVKKRDAVWVNIIKMRIN